MIKVYVCVSEISFNLKINGSKRRINFDPISGGKSQYRTNEKEVQEKIEGLDQFGNLISLSDSIKEANDLSDESNSKDEEITHNAEGEEARGDFESNNPPRTGEDNGDIQEDIISFADAKEYLLTHGCDKTIRSKEHITAYAAELGIEFPNLK